MSCPIDQNKQLKLAGKVYKDLTDIMEAKSPFSLRDYITGMYEFINNGKQDASLAQSFVQLVPDTIIKAVAFDGELRSYLKTNGMSLDEVDSLNDLFKASISNVTEYLTQGITSSTEVQETIKSDIENSFSPSNPDKPQPEFSTPSKEVDEAPVFKGAMFTDPLTTTGQEAIEPNIENNIQDPDKAFRYNFLGVLLPMLSVANALSEEMSVTYDDVPGGIFLSAMATDRLPLDKISEAQRDAAPVSVSLVITDSEGRPVYFDSSYKVTTQALGKPIYYAMRSTPVKDFDGMYDLTKTNIVKPKDQVTYDAIQRSYRQIDEIRNFVNKARKSNFVRTVITGGSTGLIQEDYSNKEGNKISSINFGGFVFDPKADAKQKGVNNPLYIELPTAPGKRLTVHRSRYSPELAQKVADAIVEDIYVRDGADLSLLSKESISQLLDAFLYSRPEGIDLKSWNRDKKTIKIKGQILDLTDKVTAKATIIDFLSRPIRNREVPKEYIKPGKNIIDIKDPDYKSKMKPGDFLMYKDPNGKITYYSITEERVNVNLSNLKTNTFRKFSLNSDSGQFIATITNDSYTEGFLKDNTYMLYPLNADRQIVGLNGYLRYAPLISDMNTINPVPEPVVAITDMPTEIPDDVTDDVDEILNKIRKNEKFNKLNGQKNYNTKVTREQIEAAKAWYESSPMSKYIPFKQMFYVVNTANPDSIATWSSDGITLFMGSDFTDLYHEAWHGFTQRFLSQQEKKRLYTDTRKMSGSFKNHEGQTIKFSTATDLDLEEWLAEDFRSFMLSGGNKKIDSEVRRSIFQRILDFLKSIFLGASYTNVLVKDTSVARIQSLYERLRMGNFNEMSFSERNQQFSNLNKGLEALDPNSEIKDLSYEDSSLIVNTVDSLFSEVVDALNSDLSRKELVDLLSIQSKESSEELTPEERSRMEGYLARKTYKYTGRVVTDKESRTQAYEYVKLMLGVRRDSFNKQLAAIQDTPETRFEREKLSDKIQILNFAIANFGDTSSPFGTKEGKGLISYHRRKSKYLSFEDKFLELETKEDDQFQKGREGFDRKGNEASPVEKSKAETLYLIRSLYKIGKDNKPEKNYLGFNELADFNITINRIFRLLENNMTPKQVYKTMRDKQKDFPELAQLLDKLGPTKTLDSEAIDMWTHFFTDVANARIMLVQMNLNHDQETDEYSLHAGESSASYKTIGLEWEDAFAIKAPGPFVKRDEEGNYLDIPAVLNKFKKITEDNSYRFYKAIGINLSSDAIVKKIVNAPNSQFRAHEWHAKLIRMHRAGLGVRGIRDIVREYEVQEGLIESLSGRYNNLQRLELRFSERHANHMVSNAAGESQSEYSLHSTRSKMITTMNNVNSYAELMALPYMQHLSIERNPFLRNNVQLHSMFDLSKPGGPKRPGAILKLENLSGIQSIVDGLYSDNGIASSEADPYTKLVTDFHMVLDKGYSEDTRPADKSTTYATRVEKLISDTSIQGKYYFDLSPFLRDPESMIRASGEQVLKYISDEYARIQAVKALSVDDPQRFVPVGNSTYYEDGQKFQIFDLVLSQPTKDKILSYTTDDFYKLLKDAEEVSSPTKEQEALRKLKSQIKKEIAVYFQTRFESVQKVYNATPFVDRKSIDNAFKTSMDAVYRLKGKDLIKTLNNYSVKERNQAALMFFVYNAWAHNYETTVMFLGDPALYNMAKEEFHKRNAGVNATGLFLRTDEDMLSYINEVMKAPYAQSEWFKKSGLKAPDFRYTSVVNTAVLDDAKSNSVYHNEYVKMMTDYLKERNKKIKDPKKRLSDAQIKTKAESIMKPYLGMKEGDAQGWVTMDHYRIFLKSMGKWERYQEDVYQRMLNGEKMDKGKLLRFFPVKKFQYWGPLNTTGLPIMAFHKFSLLPLIPTVVEGTPLEVLHNRMVEQGIGYALFQTGSKIGTITKAGKPDAFYKDQKTRELALSDPDYKFTPNPVFIDYLKDQLETSPKLKGKVIFSTQLRKLIEAGLMENAVPTDFGMNMSVDERRAIWDSFSEKKKLDTSLKYRLLRTYENHLSELVELKKQELKAEIGDNLEGLVNMVRGELEKQDFAEHSIDFIDFDKSTNDLVHDLSMSPESDRVEKILTALVNKRIIRQQVNGEPLVQVSGAGFENLGFKNSFTNPTEADYLNYLGTNDLPTYHRGKDGKTKAMKVKIALQGEFKKLLMLEHNDGTKIGSIKRLNDMLKDETWLNKGEHRQMITMVGVRIPVQGLNSMEFMEVYEFLPEAAGNVLIPPSEIVAKSGSDFDIDKLSTLMPAFNVNNGKVSIIKKLNVKENKKALTDKLSELGRKEKEIDKKYQEILDDKEKITALKFTAEDEEYLQELNREFGREFRSINTRLEDMYNLYAITRTEPVHHLPADVQATVYYAEQQYLDLLIEKYLLKERRDLYIQSYKKFTKSANLKKFEVKHREEIAPLRQEIGDINEKLASLSGKSIENMLINDMKNILELEDNFVSLIRPNGTDLFKGDEDDPGIADRLSEYSRDFDFKDRIHDGDKSRVSHTRVFEIEYNLYKHTSNNVGKQTLGIGAVDNTFNTIFNRVGMYLNPTFSQGRGKFRYDKRQQILLPHNQMDIGGQKAISLAHLYDANNDNKIDDIISQLINGWVDVAKDTWVFDIQGNKEVTPSLLLLIQAGVPLEQAIYFVSQPLVKEYIKEQTLSKSLIAGPLGVKPTDPMYYRNDARKRMILRYMDQDPIVQFAYDWKKDQYNIYPSTINDLTLSYTTRLNEENTSEEALFKNIQEGKGKLISEPSEEAIGLFLHFLEIEDMSKAVRDVKMRMNFDTSRSTTLFDAYSKQALLSQLMEDNRISEDVLQKILNESPIGSFDIQSFMINLYAPLFKLRNHKVINDFIVEKLRNQKTRTDIRRTYGDPERFVKTFRDDMLSFILQNYISFSMDDIKDYKGLTTSESIPAEEVKNLSNGAYVIGDKLYFDRRTILLQAANKTYSKDKYGISYNKTKGQYEGLGLAKVKASMFRTAEEYFNFVLEREYIRSNQPFAKLKDSPVYMETLTNLLMSEHKFKENDGEESDAHFEERMKRLAYEMMIRDIALDNILSVNKLFYGQDKDSYAEQVVNVKSDYPDLQDKFPVLRSLVLSKGVNKIKNLKLSQLRPDVDTINSYHHQLLTLANPTKIKVEDPAENQRISDLFNKFALYAFLQSGLNSTNTFSLNKLISQDMLTKILEEPVKGITENMNKDFLDLYYDRFLRANNLKLAKTRNRFKDYLITDNADKKGIFFATVDKKPVAAFIEPSFQEGELITIVDDKTGYYTLTSKKFVDSAKNLIKNHPDEIFVHNTTVEPVKTYFNTDAIFEQIAPTQSVGIPTRRKSNTVKNDMMLDDANFDQNKLGIDQAIGSMKELQDSGKRLVFYQDGYGQHLIDSKTPAIKTFLYLSEQLYKNFGYVNKNWLSMPEAKKVIQEEQPVTDEMVLEHLKTCFAV